jgi:hypothetical protein
MKQTAQLRRSTALTAFAWLLLTIAPVRALGAQPKSTALVQAVDAVTMTVSDMDCAVRFYGQVLSFSKVSDEEVTGQEYEHLQGVFGVRIRMVRMRL